MKIAVLFALVAAAVAMEGISTNQKYIHGEFMVRIDESMSKAQISSFSKSVQRLYNVQVVQSFDLRTSKFLYVKGSVENVMKINNLSNVKYVERNTVFSVAQCSEDSANGCWGLDRTDQRGVLGYTSPTSPSAVYNHGLYNGESTVAYVADTGIDVNHSEFSGRAVWGFTADGMTEGDGNGHGTHCAGTIGANSYGLAKNVALVAVKVLNNWGTGSTNQIVAGLEYVIEEHEKRSAGGMAKSVINMSLGGGANSALDDAVASCVSAGIVTVVAAGNSNANACNTSPAREPTAVTVGASDVRDQSATFTNYGTCVDIFAPGVDVLSTLPNEETAVYSGTSMAAPHVAGVVARYQDSLASAPTTDEVDAWLNSNATPNALSWSRGQHDSSPNLLLYGPCEL